MISSAGYIKAIPDISYHGLGKADTVALAHAVLDDPRLGRFLRPTLELSMVASSKIAMLFAGLMVFACAETAVAKADRSRHPGANSAASSGQVALRKKPPVPHMPSRDEKAWMERASTPTSSGPGGGM